MLIFTHVLRCFIGCTASVHRAIPLWRKITDRIYSMSALAFEKAPLQEFNLYELRPTHPNDLVALRVTTESGATYLIQRTTSDDFVVESDSNTLVDRFAPGAQTIRFDTPWCSRIIKIGQSWAYHNMPEEAWQTTRVTDISLTLLNISRLQPPVTELPPLAKL